jgi:hypothetical protein
MTEIALVGNEFAGDVSATGTIQSVLRVAAPQLANALEANPAIPQSDTIEWIAFDPTVEGLNRARGSLAIETDTNPPVVWLKVSPGGGNPMGWTALTSGGSGSASQLVYSEPYDATGSKNAGSAVTVATGNLSAALADGSGAQVCVGLLTQNWSTGDATVCGAGPLTLTTAQWDLVTGQSGGLTPGATYYVADVDAGNITSTAPSAPGDYVTVVGYAMNATTMIVQPAAPLGPL